MGSKRRLKPIWIGTPAAETAATNTTPIASSVTPAAPTGKIIDAAKKFLASLDDAQRDEVGQQLGDERGLGLLEMVDQ